MIRRLTDQMIIRVAWKEVRTQWAVFLLMLIMASLVQYLATGYVSSSFRFRDEHLRLFITYGVVGLFGALFAAASAVLMFAGEAEMGTANFVFQLAAGRTSFLWGKLLGTLGMIALFLIAAIGFPPLIANNSQQLINLVMSNKSYTVDLSAYLQYFAVNIALVTMISFAWGWLFSLLINKVLPAAFLAFATASLHIWVFLPNNVNEIYVSPFNLSSHIAIMPFRLISVVLLCGVNIYLSVVWLNRRPLSWLASRSGSDDPSPSERRGTQPRVRASAARIFSALLWQSWRQTRLATIIVWAIGLTTAVFFSYPYAYESEVGFTAGFISIPLSSLFLGLLAFYGDQQHGRFRYLANPGERPLFIVLSRISIGAFTVIAISTLIALTLSSRLGANVPNPTEFPTDWRSLWAPYWNSLAQLFVLAFPLSCLALFAVGSWCSLNIRSPLLAAALGLILSVVVLLWCLLMLSGLLPLWWTLFPITLLFLISLYLRTSDWLLQRDRWWSWLKCCAFLVLPWLFVMWGITRYRVHEVPDSLSELVEWKTGSPAPQTKLPQPTAQDLATAAEYHNRFRDAFQHYQFDESLESDASPYRELSDQAFDSQQRQLDSIGFTSMEDLEEYIIGNQVFLQDFRELLDDLQNETVLSAISNTDTLIFSNDPQPVTPADSGFDWILISRNLDRLTSANVVYQLQRSDAQATLEAILLQLNWLRLGKLDAIELDDMRRRSNPQLIERWLATEGVTAEMLDMLADKLDALASAKDFWLRYTRLNHAAAVARLERPAFYSRANRSYRPLSSWLSSISLPWEKQRAEKSLKLLSEYFLNQRQSRAERPLDSRRDSSEVSSTVLRLVSSSLYCDATHLYQRSAYLDRQGGQNRLELKLLRVACRLLQHRIETGSYPATLDAIDGNNRNNNGEPLFDYYPDGLPAELYQRIPDSKREPEAEFVRRAAANHPFIALRESLRLHRIPPLATRVSDGRKVGDEAFEIAFPIVLLPEMGGE